VGDSSHMVLRLHFTKWDFPASPEVATARA
jgi:hypothetical protein